jgi:hypothetical protein
MKGKLNKEKLTNYTSCKNKSRILEVCGRVRRNLTFFKEGRDNIKNK